jgi:CheY-like chemotaxis protein
MTSFILIAEDDPDDQRLTRDAFKEASTDHGDIKFVENGEELLNYLRSSITNSKIHRRPDIILLDLNMPKKDGREALKEIKGDLALKYIPVLIMTTSKANEDIFWSYSHGANSFIIKPPSFNSLVQTLREIQQYWFHMAKLPQQRTNRNPLSGI